MAIDRFLMQNNRILISKAGYVAIPGMADENKIFDSDWDFTGTLLASGAVQDQAPQNAGVGRTFSTTPTIVAIPVPFTPRDIFIRIIPYVNGNGDYGPLPAGLSTYSSGSLIVQRNVSQGSNPQSYLVTDFRFRLFSV